MPLFNHINIGDVQSHVYLEGKILKVYLEDAISPLTSGTPPMLSMRITRSSTTLLSGITARRLASNGSNGAIVDGGRGFDVDDRVILMAKIGTTHGRGEEYGKMYVVAHRDGVVPCTYNYLLIRMSAGDLIPHNPPYGKWVSGAYVPSNPGSHSREYVTVPAHALDRCEAHIKDVRVEHTKYFGIQFPYWYGVAQLKTESACRTNITAFDAGQGIAQFMPKTAQYIQSLMGEALDPYNPRQAIRMQAFYMNRIHRTENWTDRLWISYQIYNGGKGTLYKEYQRAEICWTGIL